MAFTHGIPFGIRYVNKERLQKEKDDQKEIWVPTLQATLLTLCIVAPAIVILAKLYVYEVYRHSPFVSIAIYTLITPIRMPFPTIVLRSFIYSKLSLFDVRNYRPLWWYNKDDFQYFDEIEAINKEEYESGMKSGPKNNNSNTACNTGNTALTNSGMKDSGMNAPKERIYQRLQDMNDDILYNRLKTSFWSLKSYVRRRAADRNEYPHMLVDESHQETGDGAVGVMMSAELPTAAASADTFNAGTSAKTRTSATSILSNWDLRINQPKLDLPWSVFPLWLDAIAIVLTTFLYVFFALTGLFNAFAVWAACQFIVPFLVHLNFSKVPRTIVWTGLRIPISIMFATFCIEFPAFEIFRNYGKIKYNVIINGIGIPEAISDIVILGSCTWVFFPIVMKILAGLAFGHLGRVQSPKPKPRGVAFGDEEKAFYQDVQIMEDGKEQTKMVGHAVMKRITCGPVEGTSTVVSGSGSMIGVNPSQRSTISSQKSGFSLKQKLFPDHEFQNAELEPAIFAQVASTTSNFRRQHTAESVGEGAGGAGSQAAASEGVESAGTRSAGLKVLSSAVGSSLYYGKIGGFDSGHGRGYRTRDRYFADAMYVSILGVTVGFRIFLSRFLTLKANNLTLCILVVLKDLTYMYIHFILTFDPAYQMLMARIFAQSFSDENEGKENSDLMSSLVRNNALFNNMNLSPGIKAFILFLRLIDDVWFLPRDIMYIGPDFVRYTPADVFKYRVDEAERSGIGLVVDPIMRAERCLDEMYGQRPIFYPNFDKFATSELRHTLCLRYGIETMLITNMPEIDRNGVLAAKKRKEKKDKEKAAALDLEDGLFGTNVTIQKKLKKPRKNMKTVEGRRGELGADGPQKEGHELQSGIQDAQSQSESDYDMDPETGQAESGAGQSGGQSDTAKEGYHQEGGISRSASSANSSSKAMLAGASEANTQSPNKTSTTKNKLLNLRSRKGNRVLPVEIDETNRTQPIFSSELPSWLFPIFDESTNVDSLDTLKKSNDALAKQALAKQALAKQFLGVRAKENCYQNQANQKQKKPHTQKQRKSSGGSNEALPREYKTVIVKGNSNICAEMLAANPNWSSSESSSGTSSDPEHDDAESEEGEDSMVTAFLDRSKKSNSRSRVNSRRLKSNSRKSHEGSYQQGSHQQEGSRSCSEKTKSSLRNSLDAMEGILFKKTSQEDAVDIDKQQRGNRQPANVEGKHSAHIGHDSDSDAEGNHDDVEGNHSGAEGNQGNFEENTNSGGLILVEDDVTIPSIVTSPSVNSWVNLVHGIPNKDAFPLPNASPNSNAISLSNMSPNNGVTSLPNATSAKKKKKVTDGRNTGGSTPSGAATGNGATGNGGPEASTSFTTHLTNNSIIVHVTNIYTQNIVKPTTPGASTGVNAAGAGVDGNTSVNTSNARGGIDREQKSSIGDRNSRSSGLQENATATRTDRKKIWREKVTGVDQKTNGFDQNFNLKDQKTSGSDPPSPSHYESFHNAPGDHELNLPGALSVAGNFGSFLEEVPTATGTTAGATTGATAAGAATSTEPAARGIAKPAAFAGSHLTSGGGGLQQPGDRPLFKVKGVTGPAKSVLQEKDGLGQSVKNEQDLQDAFKGALGELGEAGLKAFLQAAKKPLNDEGDSESESIKEMERKEREREAKEKAEREARGEVFEVNPDDILAGLDMGERILINTMYNAVRLKADELPVRDNDNDLDASQRKEEEEMMTARTLFSSIIKKSFVEYLGGFVNFLCCWRCGGTRGGARDAGAGNHGSRSHNTVSHIAGMGNGLGRDGSMVIDNTIDFTMISAITQAKIHKMFIIRAYLKFMSSIVMIGVMVFFPYKNYDYWDCVYDERMDRYDCDTDSGNVLIDYNYAVYLEKPEAPTFGMIISVIFLIQDILELLSVNIHHRRSPNWWFIHHQTNASLCMGRLPESLGKYGSYYVRSFPYWLLMILSWYMVERTLRFDLGSVKE